MSSNIVLSAVECGPNNSVVYEGIDLSNLILPVKTGVRFTLKPGQILLFKKKDGFDPVGSFITAEERDTDVCHAAFVGKNGEIWTTGAISHFGLPIFYGSANPSEYLLGRDFYICEFDSLTPDQIDIMQANAERMKGMIYGFHKILILTQKAKLGGIVRRLYPWLTKIVTKPICSEAVAYCCWRAGERVCEVMGKEEPSAITPSNLKSFAQLKGSNLNIIQEVNQ